MNSSTTNAIIGTVLLFSQAIANIGTIHYTAPTDYFDAASQEFSQTGLVGTTTAEMAVEQVFGTTTQAVDIATCESGLIQYDTPNHVHRNADMDAVGLFQILVDTHKAEAEKMGYDIYTLQGNIMYAHFLYQTYGTSPWNASEKCWQKLVAEG